MKLVSTLKNLERMNFDIMKPVINRADIIGGLKSVELAKKNPQNYQPGVGVSENFTLLPNFK